MSVTFYLNGLDFPPPHSQLSLLYYQSKFHIEECSFCFWDFCSLPCSREKEIASTLTFLFLLIQLKSVDAKGSLVISYFPSFICQ